MTHTENPGFVQIAGDTAEAEASSYESGSGRKRRCSRATRMRKFARTAPLMLMVAASLSVSMTSCTTATLQNTVPGVWQGQYIDGATGVPITVDWAINSQTLEYAQSFSSPFGVISGTTGTWLVREEIQQLRFNVITWFPCAPSGCTPATRPPGDSYTVEIITANQLRVTSPLGAVVIMNRLA